MKNAIHILFLSFALISSAHAADPREQMNEAVAKAGNPPDMDEIARNPSIVANQKLYFGMVALEAQDGAYIRTVANWLTRKRGERIQYVYIKFTKGTHMLAEPKFGQAARLLGRYVDNVQYSVRGGGVMTAPLVEVTYIQPYQP